MELLKNIKGVTCDSRNVKPGFAFVAIQGTKRDGHEFIEDALKRGASMIITEKSIKLNSNTQVQIQQVKDGRVMLAKLAASLYEYPSQKLITIGITGTNGKTTTSFLLYHLLNENKIGCGLLGTVDIDTGLQKMKAELTTPNAVELQKYLKEMVEAKLKAVSMEVSSHGIELQRTYGVDFNLAILTNLTRDHFDFHHDFDTYARTKKRLFQQLKKEAIALINGDDPHGSFISRDIQAQIITYGLTNKNMIYVDNIQKDNFKTKFDLIIKNPIITPMITIQPMNIPIEIKLPGTHNLYNSLCACGAGLLVGLNNEQIKKISNYSGVWRRFQIVYDKDFTIIDDCAHNPGSYTAIFKTLKDLNYKTLYIINAIRGNRGTQINKDNARTIANWMKQLQKAKLMITNCSDLVRKDDLVTPEEERAFLQTLEDLKTPYEHNSEIQPLFKTLKQKVKPGDLIVLLGAHAMDKASELIMQKVDI